MIIADLLAAVRNDRSNLVRLLDKWSLKWKHKGRTTAVGPNAFEKYCTLGLYGHGCISGISRASNEEDLQSRQSFLKSRFPCKLGLPSRFFAIRKWDHRDLLNFQGHPNHAVALGSFSGLKMNKAMKTKTLAGLAVGWPRASTAVFFCPWLGA